MYISGKIIRMRRKKRCRKRRPKMNEKRELKGRRE